jgi:5'-3' exonuclease
MTARLVNQYKPDRLALCLDGDWRPSWRVELFPDYKSNRVLEDGEEEEPDLLTPQIPIITDFFDALGIPLIGADDYEADDVIATLSRTEAGPVRIVTGDRDLFQLVDDDKDVKIAYLAKGISAHDLVDTKWISMKYQIPGERYGFFSMIRGDASDGLPGIRGIGEKGAAAIAQEFSSMIELIDAAKSSDSRLKPIHQKKILEDLEYAKNATRLVTCVTDVRLPKVDLVTPKEPASRKELAELVDEYGLKTNLQRLESALGW